MIWEDYYGVQEYIDGGGAVVGLVIRSKDRKGSEYGRIYLWHMLPDKQVGGESKSIAEAKKAVEQAWVKEVFGD